MPRAHPPPRPAVLGRMSNKTAKGAHAVHGKDPQLLVEKIIRERIYENIYWKEDCFGLNAETILDKAVELDHVGGTYGNQKPCSFLCLLLKLLQIQPSIPIVHEYIQQEDFKYLRVLGLMYFRMVSPAFEIYKTLEPLLADKRKLRVRTSHGSYGLTYMDEVVDELLTKDRVFDIILPRLTKRTVLEDADELEERPLFFSINDETGSSELPVNPNLEGSFRDKESLSTEETNILRKSLGLQPLNS